MIEQTGVPIENTELENKKLQFKEQMLNKYGPHDGVWIKFEFINTLGLGEPRFRDIYFLSDLAETGPKIDLRIKNFPHQKKNYDQIPPLLQEILLGQTDPYLPRKKGYGEGGAAVKIFDVKKMGVFPLKDKSMKIMGEAQPYSVLSVLIPTDINETDLSKLIGE